MTRDEAHFTRIVKKHDIKLFCRENPQMGCIQVLREAYRAERVDFSEVTGIEGDTLAYPVSSPYYIMSLTDNWNATGSPAHWGELPLLKRLRDIDGWERDSLANTWEEKNKKQDEKEHKDFCNKTEDFAYEFRDQFKKTFADVNTSSMEKIDKRRIKGE